MIISLVVATLLAILFGRITIKEIKEYVRKHKDRTGRDSSGNTGN